MLPKWRPQMAMIVETTACGFGIILMSLIGHIFTHWRYFELTLVTLMVVTMPVFIMIPESYRWFFSKKYVFRKVYLRMPKQINL